MTVSERNNKYLASAYSLLVAKREMAELNPPLSDKIQNILDEVLDDWIAFGNKIKGESRESVSG